jgi:uncharacterized coiled-coil protein SlyX
MKWDSTITLGNMLSIGTILVGLAVGYTQMQATIEAMDQRITAIETQAQASASGQQQEASGLEDRLRAVEILQASQSSDLRNIQTGINEIKVAISRIGVAQ